MILVSACLAGLNCKYNGKNNYNEKIFELVKNGETIPLCAETLGGLTTPRIPCEIINGRVINKDGIDVSENYKRGALEIVEFCKKMNIKEAILQPRSPSCGVGKIYDGTFSKTLIDGNGILTQMLIDNDIKVMSLDDYINNIENI